MSLALLSGVNPRACKETGPRVRVHEGTFKLSTVGLVDSKLALLLDGVQFEIAYPLEPAMHFTSKGLIAQVIFLERGTEQHFSVFAELVTNGTIVSTT